MRHGRWSPPAAVLRVASPSLHMVISVRSFPFSLPQGSSLLSEIQVSDRVDIEALRERLRKMTDAELLRFGKDNRYMCSPYANLGKPPLEAFVIQLLEARAEWRRRHPKA